MQKKLKVNEVFYTIQGEGIDAGVPAIFIRLAGCNFEPCTWKVNGKTQYCDTMYANKGKLISVESLMKRIANLKPVNVKPIIVITGGEPTLWWEEIEALLDNLSTPLYHIDIESNGSLPSEMLEHSNKLYKWVYKFNHYVVSPKPQTPPENIVALSDMHLTPVYFKFVYDGTNFDFIRETLMRMRFINPDHIYLMSAGCNAEELKERDIETVELCKKYGYRFSARLQSYLYGKKRGV